MYIYIIGEDYFPFLYFAYNTTAAAVAAAATTVVLYAHPV
jgi:hypothetical protein